MSKFFAAIMAFFTLVLSWFGINIGGDNKPTEPVTVPTQFISTTEPTTQPTTEPTTQPTTEPTTQPTTEPTTQPTTEPTTQPTTEPTTQPTTEPTTQPESNKVRENAYKTNIAFGCTYVKDREAHENYPDTYAAELTDGMYKYSQYASYSNASMSGYTRLWSSAMKIDVELKNSCNKIYGFELSFLATTDAGINIPESVTIYISDDGENWTKTGNAVIPQEIDSTIKQAVLTLDEYVSARYVRFSVYADSAFVFLDEVLVNADVEPNASGSDFAADVANAYALYGSVDAPESGTAVDKTLDKVSVSKDKPYQISCEAAAPFTDNGVVITDGSSGNTYESGAYVGIDSKAEQTITIDLGETVDDIAGVEAYVYSRMPSNISLPSALSFTAISADGTRTPIGARYATLKNEIGKYVFSLELDNTVSAAKIEVAFGKTPCADKYLVDEVNVYAYRSATAKSKPYPLVKISLEDNGEFSETDEDYNVYQNLLLNSEPQIVAQAALTDFQNDHNTGVDSCLLTDGNHSTSTNIYCGKYQIFYCGKSRQIVFDLKKPAAIDKLTCEFTNQTSWAVYAPSQVRAYLSENGSDWYETDVMTVDTSVDPAVVSAVLEMENAVRARYVCFEFRVNIFTGCSEIEAFGTKNTDEAAALADAGFEKVQLFENERITPSDSLLDGAKDTCLLYHSKTFGYTAEQLIPYVGYIDGEGNIKDTMFDSFLFLMSGPFPSGLSSATDSKLTDWQWCINDLFTENENILALEEAAGTVKEALGLPDDYVYPFTVTAYCPSVSRTDFGDIDGDGVNEDFSTDEGRIKALNAFADMFESRLAQYNFKNIKFSGYYWMKESMDTANRDNVVAKAFSEYVHERGYDFFWIPYLYGNGYNCWQSYGFDCAVMQPNYVFTSDAPYTKLVDCAALTELYGMGIEMEISSASFNSDEFFKRYMKYLSDGVKYGYMDDTVVMYYQELLIYHRAAHTDGGRGRLIYDNTHDFIKGTLDLYPEKLPDQSFTCEKNTPLDSELTLPDTMWHEILITKLPEKGTLTMNSDGTFMYFPEKDFTGEVEFNFTYSTSFEHSEECKAIITVNE